MLFCFSVPLVKAIVTRHGIVKRAHFAVTTTVISTNLGTLPVMIVALQLCQTNIALLLTLSVVKKR